MVDLTTKLAREATTIPEVPIETNDLMTKLAREATTIPEVLMETNNLTTKLAREATTIPEIPMPTPTLPTTKTTKVAPKANTKEKMPTLPTKKKFMDPIKINEEHRGSSRYPLRRQQRQDYKSERIFLVVRDTKLKMKNKKKLLEKRVMERRGHGEKPEDLMTSAGTTEKAARHPVGSRAKEVTVQRGSTAL